MKASKLLANATFGPEQLKAISKAFDDAWELVEPQVSTRPEAIEAARLKLAEIVLSMTKNGTLDPQQLTASAVRVMLADPTKFQPRA